jgi:hypothetical protein
MSSLIFNSCLVGALRGRINVDADDFGVMLLDESYEPSKDHSNRYELMDYEIRAKGYETGGLSASVFLDVASLSGGGTAIDVHLGPAKWSGSLRARYAAYYRKSTNAEDDDLVAVIDFGGPVVSTNGPFEVSESVLRIEN